MNVYERKIDLIELELDFENECKQFKYLEEKYTGSERVLSVDNKIYTPDQALVPCKIGLLTAYTTSPSKTNIMIGWMLVVLSVLFSSCYVVGLLDVIKIKDFISFDILCNIVTVLGIAVFYFFGVYIILKFLRHDD